MSQLAVSVYLQQHLVGQCSIGEQLGAVPVMKSCHTQSTPQWVTERGVHGFMQSLGDCRARLLLSSAEDAQNKDKARKKKTYHEFNACKYQRTHNFVKLMEQVQNVYYTDYE